MMKECPDCSGEVSYYDSVKRIVRGKHGRVCWITVERLQRKACGRIHRSLPANVYPYNQYDKEIIDGVVEGLISSCTYGFEDYPCEMTMNRWKSSRNLHLPL